MESVDSTSRVRPLMLSVHFDKWRVSLKNSPCGSSGLASTSPLGFETRNVEPSRVLIVFPLINTSPQLFQSLSEMLTHPNRVGYRRQRRVHRADADEKARID